MFPYFKITFIVIFLNILPLSAQGQDTILLTKNFQFADGIYLSIEDLQVNQPSFSWGEMNSDLFTNPQTLLTKIGQLTLPDGVNEISLDPTKIFAVVINGVPSVRMNSQESESELTTFAALRVRGAICYFSYPEVQRKTVTFQAYNPKNGRPFRTSSVEREETVTIEKMMDFKNGTIAPMTVDNFLKWIADDKDLVASIADLPPAEQQKKLYKCLLIYNDRNDHYMIKP